LLGEHVELHVIVGAILRGHGGFSRHPQTLRYVNHLRMLYDRHRQQVEEMLKRGYKHKSPLPKLEPSSIPEPFTYTTEEEQADMKVLVERQNKT